MIDIIEKISWIPSKLTYKFKSKKEYPIKLNFKKIGVNKQFRFYTLKEDEGLSNQLNTFGFREPLNIKYTHYFITKDYKVLDIGANIGLFSLISHNAKKIVSVEPIKECIPILRKNLKENGLASKSKIINMAVGKKGKLTLKKEGKVNLSRVVDKGDKNTIEIKSNTLDYFSKKYNVNLLRIDVEGYEYEILMDKIPKKIKKIAIEFHTALLGKKKVKALLNYFRDGGFHIKYFVEDLPIRLYPFYTFLRNTKLIELVTYIKRDLSYEECLKYIWKGRKVKYLFLER